MRGLVVLPKLPYCRVMSRLYATGCISCVRHTDNSSPYEAVDRHFCNFFPPCDRLLRIVSDIDCIDCNGTPLPPPPPPLPPEADVTELWATLTGRRTGLPVAPANVEDDAPAAAAAADDCEPMVRPASEPPPMLLRS